jgi:hypothetical protein
LSENPELFGGQEEHFYRLPIGSYTIPIRDPKGKPLPLASTETPGKGEFDLSIRMAKPYNSHCGWIQKQASQMISFTSGSSFKPRYMVLLEGVLNYYDNEHSLDHSRGTMKCSDITFLDYGPDKNGELTLVIHSEAEEWYFRWMEGETEVNKTAWVRKIANCSPNVQQRESLQRTSSINNLSSPTHVIDVKNTGKLKKRASLLFGGKK